MLASGRQNPALGLRLAEISPWEFALLGGDSKQRSPKSDRGFFQHEALHFLSEVALAAVTYVTLEHEVVVPEGLGNDVLNG